MKLPRKRWIALAAVPLLAAAGAAAWFTLFRQPPLDPRFNGAYRLESGGLLFVTARTGDTLRASRLNGESRALQPAGGTSFTAGPGWSDPGPVEVRAAFSLPGEGPPEGLTWTHPDGREEPARRLGLPEAHFTFTSDGLALRAKLVLPEGEGPFPAVVLVHGSGRESAVDTFGTAYLFAAHGIAALAYDKRGTGGSEGEYTQNFHVLARDVTAAVDWLRQRPEIDPRRIHLAGYSQGGWIAPLAAARAPGKVRSLLIAYGPMVPVTGEDRWGYVYALQQKGFGEEAVREADRVNDVLSAIVDRRENRWDELERLLEESSGEPWFEALKGSDSMLGFVAGTRMPLWAVRLYSWWFFDETGDEAFIDRVYDPVPIVGSLTATPSLWLLADEDESMPTGWTVEKLAPLQAAGRPIEVKLYPGTDHGILRFEQAPDGTRRYLGYHPEYLGDQVEWLRRQSGLPETEPASSARSSAE